MNFQDNNSVAGSPEQFKGAGMKSEPRYQEQLKEWGVCEATTVTSLDLYRGQCT